MKAVLQNLLIHEHEGRIAIHKPSPVEPRCHSYSIWCQNYRLAWGLAHYYRCLNRCSGLRC